MVRKTSCLVYDDYQLLKRLLLVAVCCGELLLLLQKKIQNCSIGLHG